VVQWLRELNDEGNHSVDWALGKRLVRAPIDYGGAL
jgi:hypothetical protein